MEDEKNYSCDALCLSPGDAAMSVGWDNHHKVPWSPDSPFPPTLIGPHIGTGSHIDWINTQKTWIGFSFQRIVELIAQRGTD